MSDNWLLLLPIIIVIILCTVFPPIVRSGELVTVVNKDGSTLTCVMINHNTCEVL